MTTNTISALEASVNDTHNYCCCNALSIYPRRCNRSHALTLKLQQKLTFKTFRSSPSGQWSLCQGTGTADQADHATPGCGPLNQIWHRSTTALEGCGSTLVWQLPIVERRIDQHAARSKERRTNPTRRWWSYDDDVITSDCIRCHIQSHSLLQFKLAAQMCDKLRTGGTALQSSTDGD